MLHVVYHLRVSNSSFGPHSTHSSVTDSGYRPVRPFCRVHVGINRAGARSPSSHPLNPAPQPLTAPFKAPCSASSSEWPRWTAPSRGLTATICKPLTFRLQAHPSIPASTLHLESSLLQDKADSRLTLSDPRHASTSFGATQIQRLAASQCRSSVCGVTRLCQASAPPS
jgi:hypothetical protein